MIAGDSFLRRWAKALGLPAGRRAGAIAADAVESPTPAGCRLVEVTRIQIEAPDVKSFELTSVDGRPLPPPSPGAHIDIHAAAGTVRQYALCNGPGETPGYVVAVRRDSASSGASRALHDTLGLGDRLVIGEPRNHFPLHAGAARHVLLAQGIGVAPMVAMAKALAAEGADFSLDYFVRSPEHAPFRSLLQAPPLGDHTRLHCGFDAAQQAGRLRELLSRPAADAHLYVCGSRAFMDLVLREAQAWPTDNVHCEYFDANPAAWAGQRRAFRVRLAKRETTLEVPDDLTLAAALQRAGVAVRAPCGQGVCGDCAVAVLAGRPDHRDAVLTALERERGDRIITCVSRALDPELTLDL